MFACLRLGRAPPSTRHIATDAWRPELQVWTPSRRTFGRLCCPLRWHGTAPGEGGVGEWGGCVCAFVSSYHTVSVSFNWGREEEEGKGNEEGRWEEDGEEEPKKQQRKMNDSPRWMSHDALLLVSIRHLETLSRGQGLSDSSHRSEWKPVIGQCLGSRWPKVRKTPPHRLTVSKCSISDFYTILRQLDNQHLANGWHLQP